MKKLIMAILLATQIQACITPMMPIPPMGCTRDNAVLIYKVDGGCYWMFVDCWRKK